MKELLIQKETTSNTLPKSFLFNQNELIIPKNVQYLDPIKITIDADQMPHFKVVVSESTSIKIILEIRNVSQLEHVYNIDLIAEKNSHVKYLLVSEIESTKSTINHTFIAKRDAKLEIITGLVSNVLDAKLHVDLVEEGAEVKMRAVAVSSDDNVQNVDVFITHKAPHTFGDMTNIGIANKRGKIILNGVEKIEKGMKLANAFQTLKGIITSDQAIVEVNPILLIDEYDVKAGHGATIGKIEEDVLYYLMSRGLNRKEAEKLVIHGFLKPVIDEIDDEPLRERFESLVNSRI
jgi:Fe-S cluster assembly protein SufD